MSVRNGLAFFLLLLSSITWAQAVVNTSFEDPQFIEDERAAVGRLSAAWADAINDHDPEKTVSFYANQISVYATFQTKIQNYRDLLSYFTALSKKPNFKVVFDEENIRVYGPTAINSGVYTFSYTKNDKLVEIPARFTFVYALGASGWKIVEHHSSILPE